MKILIAEDEATSRELLETFLGEWGYQVIAAADGDQAWRILEGDDAPTLAILDWMMPGMTGPQICRRVRERTGEAYVYILLLTVRTDKQDLIEGLESGADDYLTKPFDARELRVRLRAARRILDLQEQIMALRAAARFPGTHDPETGLWNRRTVEAFLGRELSRSRRGARPLGVLVAQLDGLEETRQRYGEAAGQAVLRETAARLCGAVRLYDLIGRYQDGAFLVVVPEGSRAEAARQGEAARASVGGAALDVLGRSIAATVSVGAASTEGASGVGLQALLEAAEAAAVRAGGAGGNRVEAAGMADFLAPVLRAAP